MPTLIRLASILLISSIISCSSLSSPWTCTPDTCGAVATQSLPDEILLAAGQFWEDGDGHRIQVARIGGEGLPPLTTTAIVMGAPFIAPGTSAQLFSFGGRVVVEVRTGPGRNSPRQFMRLSAEDDELLFAPLDLGYARSVLEEIEVQIVNSEHGPALSYRDVRNMAGVITTLLADDTMWAEGTVFWPAS